MKTIIVKFGGSSLADPGKIRRAAAIILTQRRRGLHPVVVVSAPANATDELLALAARAGGKKRSARETDALLAAGEQFSAALMAMALEGAGAAAVSLTGAQAGITTNSRYGDAGIKRVNPARLKKELKSGKIPVVAGFQGINAAGDITTLGRGGSDLTAVALARAINASVCDFLTDVKGIYTAHPALVPDARKIHKISYAEVITLAHSGTEVRQLRAVRYAAAHNITLQLRSSFHSEAGTLITAAGGTAGVTCLSIQTKGQTARVALIGRELGASEKQKALTAARNAGIPARAEKAGRGCITLAVPAAQGETLLKTLHAVFI
ncbi:MAG: hypothetical protein A2285_04870 [Elusimicrobia bacterium RIFOXYA12_FULL_57_11]|nr:MAG: hypothetical protein A2285_04870 [Elusimicrobia bacterium RIFOXYA12_FULL_57_11]